MVDFNLKNNIKLIIKYEFKRFFFKSIFINTNLPSYLRFKAASFLSLLNRRTSLSYLRLRCIFTNRSRFLLSHFKQSRMSFRLMYSSGNLPGLQKSSS